MLVCTACSSALSPGCNFCPFCGISLSQPVPHTLDQILAKFQLHFGHDYRRRDQDVDGTTTAVYWLGASENTIHCMMALLPKHMMSFEHQRRSGVGDTADWLRVDIVPRPSRISPP